jgi:hypothetical protein
MPIRHSLEFSVTKTWPVLTPTISASNKRTAERRSVSLPARLTWKDQRGTTRFASVITRNVSEVGVFVECQGTVSIPLYRLVQFQLERDVRDSDPLPAALRSGRILSAVYRVASPAANGGRQGLALRLLVDPKRRAAEVPEVQAATA